MDSFKKLSGYARFCSFALYMCAAVSFLSLTADVGLMFVGDIPNDPEKISVPQMIVGVWALVVGILYFIVFIATAFGVCQWMYRAYINLHVGKIEGLSTKPIWAVFYWFVPFVSMVMPLFLMKEIYYASDVNRQADGPPFKKMSSPPRMVIWWICWIVSNIIANVSLRLNMGEGTSSPPLMDAGGEVLTIISAFFLVYIIKEITARQEALFPDLKD